MSSRRLCSPLRTSAQATNIDACLQTSWLDFNMLRWQLVGGSSAIIFSISDLFIVLFSNILILLAERLLVMDTYEQRNCSAKLSVVVETGESRFQLCRIYTTPWYHTQVTESQTFQWWTHINVNVIAYVLSGQFLGSIPFQPGRSRQLCNRSQWTSIPFRACLCSPPVP